MAVTKLENLVNPEVYAPMVSAELQKAIRFAPLAQVDTTLEGTPGNTLTVSRFEYMGDAAVIGEGQPIPMDQLGTNTADVKVFKIGKGTQLTDESILSGLGDPVGESTQQLGMALGNTVDTALLEVALSTQTQTVSLTEANLTTDSEGEFQKALDVFNDDGDFPYVAIMSPKTAGKVRLSLGKNTEKAVNALVSGTYLDVLGVQVVRTRKISDDKIVFIKVNPKSPALKLVMKRGVQVESDRDIVRKMTIITADEYFAPYVYNPANIVVATITGASNTGSDSLYDALNTPTASQTKGQIENWLLANGKTLSDIKNKTKTELLAMVSEINTPTPQPEETPAPTESNTEEEIKTWLLAKNPERTDLDGKTKEQLLQLVAAEQG